jgi:hypothetical protein
MCKGLDEDFSDFIKNLNVATIAIFFGVSTTNTNRQRYTISACLLWVMTTYARNRSINTQIWAEKQIGT